MRVSAAHALRVAPTVHLRRRRRWWEAYAERKDDEDEYVADTLLYDKTHLPRTAPAPDCVPRKLQVRRRRSAGVADAGARPRRGSRPLAVAARVSLCSCPAADAPQVTPPPSTPPPEPQ